ncbi:MAG: aquaporin [Candidatus Rokuibacteriota bacterium]
MREALRRHWPEYLIEAVGLGLFMLSASLFGVLLFHDASPAARAVGEPHFNPALTLTFFRLGKVTGWDAFFYVAAQCVGGLRGMRVTRCSWASITRRS